MALMQETAPLVLNVTRREVEMVVPAQPTPREEKPLSDIDDQEMLRYHMPGIMFYQADPSLAEKGKDPVKAVKEGLAKALVFYYPFAGRLKEGPNLKLIVDCTGEGVPFVEAEADATLQDFGDEIHPPFPHEELLYDIGTDRIIGTPLLIFQVTRLKCGGFIVAFGLNHTMADAIGLMQLMRVVGEMARCLPTPTILPIWDRERLMARNPPCVTFAHHEYDQNNNDHLEHSEPINLVQKCFLFGRSELAALYRHVPCHIKRFSTFDILVASLWRCRTIALGYDLNDEVYLTFAINARSKFNPPLPNGYYGNACAFPVVQAKAGEMLSKPLRFILELITKVKAEINEEYMRSIADLMVTQNRPDIKLHRKYLVSDLRHLGFADVDFGWGKPVFGGPARYDYWEDGFFISTKNQKGESVIMVPMLLPPSAMEIFVKELQGMLNVHA